MTLVSVRNVVRVVAAISIDLARVEPTPAPIIGLDLVALS
jgi:hypothetical protein